jgi:hypothetical protein
MEEKKMCELSFDELGNLHSLFGAKQEVNPDNGTFANPCGKPAAFRAAKDTAEVFGHVFYVCAAHKEIAQETLDHTAEDLHLEPIWTM